jgi:hypothetical protein
MLDSGSIVIASTCHNGDEAHPATKPDTSSIRRHANLKCHIFGMFRIGSVARLTIVWLMITPISRRRRSKGRQNCRRLAALPSRRGWAIPLDLEDNLLILLSCVARHIRAHGDELALSLGTTRAESIVLVPPAIFPWSRLRNEARRPDHRAWSRSDCLRTPWRAKRSPSGVPRVGSTLEGESPNIHHHAASASGPLGYSGPLLDDFVSSPEKSLGSGFADNSVHGRMGLSGSRQRCRGLLRSAAGESAPRVSPFPMTHFTLRRARLSLS